MAQLTPNAIQQIYSGSIPPQPVLQVIDIKKISNQSTGPERYRIIVSDGTYFQQAMLATQLNQLLQEEKLVLKSIVQLNDYICNSVHNRRIIIILQMEILGLAEQKIGAPVNIEDPAPAAQAPQAAPQQQAPRAQPVQQNYQRPPQQQQAAPQQNFAQRQQQAPQNNFRQNVAANRPPPGRDDYSQTVILPIAKLNFHVNRWTIKARVTHKSDVREFNSAKMPSGKGKLISVDLLDAQGGEIRATMFGDAVDLFGPILEVGRVYYISRGIVKAAYKKSSSLKNDFELTLDRNSVVQLCEDDDGNIPSVVFAATPIARIQDLMKDEVIDVLALVTGTSELQNVNTKNGSTMKRTLVLLDQSKATVELTLWGNHAMNFDQNFNGIIGAKGVKVSDFHGRTLTSLSSSQLVLDPNTPEAQALMQWSSTLDSSIEVTPLSIDNSNFSRNNGEGGAAGPRPPRERKTFGQIKEEGLGRGKPAYFAVKGTVNNIKHDVGVYYNACPTCAKKVNLQNGVWVCDKCNDSRPQCDRRYLLSLQATDHTGAQWLNGFNEVGEKILNRSAAEVAQLKEDKNDAEYEAVFQEASLRSYLFTIRAKEETYQEETRVKYSIVNLEPLDYVAESRSLLGDINRLLSVA